jgi:NitT/TauT family transport system permease protein
VSSIPLPLARPGERPDGVAVALSREARARAHQKALELVLAVVVPFLMLVLWEVLSRAGALDVRFFSAPSLIGTEMWESVASGDLPRNLAATALRVLFAFGIGASVGTSCGLLMGRSEIVRAALYPLISTLYPVPKVVILPLLLLAFGFSEPTRVLPGALSAFFLTSVSTLGGVLAVRQTHLDVARDLGANPSQVYATVVWPTALPMIFGGFRLAWGIATVTTISVELVVSSNGLGSMLWAAWELFRIAEMFVALLTISAFGLLSFGLIDFIHSRVIPWQR